MSAEAERIFHQVGAILEGHFLLSSGLHSPVYWEKFHLLQYPQYTEQLCRMIAQHFQHQGIQLVTGPTMGGIILAYEVARQLGVRSSFAEGEGEHRVFKRFTITPGERSLVVDDILTTGDSIRQVMAEVYRHGGGVMGVGVLVDRSGGKVDFGVPLFSCCQSSSPTYSPQDCPLCRAKVPLSTPGSNAHL